MLGECGKGLVTRRPKPLSRLRRVGLLDPEVPSLHSNEWLHFWKPLRLSSLVVVSESGKVLRALTALPSLNAG